MNDDMVDVSFISVLGFVQFVIVIYSSTTIVYYIYTVYMMLCHTKNSSTTSSRFINYSPFTMRPFTFIDLGSGACFS